MNRRALAACAAAAVMMLLGPPAQADAPDGREILRRALASDPWGMAGAEVTAQITRRDGDRVIRRLGYSLKSRRHAALLSKVLLRITAPADSAGAGLLIVHQAGRDDDRFLYVPQAGRTRRISGGATADDFMGSGFSYADLDRRFMRTATPTLRGTERVENIACYRLELVVADRDVPYSRVEAWVSQDTWLTLQLVFYDRRGRAQKRIAARETQRVNGQWFITRASLTSFTDRRTTELVVTRVVPRDDLPDAEFTVRALEKP